MDGRGIRDQCPTCLGTRWIRDEDQYIYGPTRKPPGRPRWFYLSLGGFLLGLLVTGLVVAEDQKRGMGIADHELPISHISQPIDLDVKTRPYPDRVAYGESGLIFEGAINDNSEFEFVIGDTSVETLFTIEGDGTMHIFNQVLVVDDDEPYKK